MEIAILYSTYINSASQIKNTAEAYFAQNKTHHSASILPITSGGRGFIDAMEAMPGTKATRATTIARDRHSNPIETSYLISHDGKTACIECAKICGYDPGDNYCNPATTFTHGIGDVILDALSRNCRNFIIGIDGLATIDAGMGMLNALGYKMHNEASNELQLYRGSEMLRVHSVTDSRNTALLKRCRFTIAHNDNAAFYAATGPAALYARQLGANEVTADILDNGLRNMASVYFHHNGRDVSYITAGGAGGAIAGAFASFFNAKLRPATSVLPGTAQISKAMNNANAIIIISHSITPTTISSPAFASLMATAKKSNAPIYHITTHIQNAPMLEAMDVRNITPTDDPATELVKLLDHIVPELADE